MKIDLKVTHRITDVEKVLYQYAFNVFQGVQHKMAVFIGVSIRTVRNKIKLYGISGNRKRVWKYCNPTLELFLRKFETRAETIEALKNSNGWKYALDRERRNMMFLLNNHFDLKEAPKLQ